MKRVLFVVGFVMLGALAAGAWMLLAKAEFQRADPRNAAQVVRGAKVYQDKCARCHGQELEGQPNWQRRKPDGRLPAPPHDATGHTWHHADAQLFQLTKDGLTPPIAPDGYQSDMPSFGGVLTDDDIWAVLAYIKSTWPLDIRERQAQIDKTSRK